MRSTSHGRRSARTWNERWCSYAETWEFKPMDDVARQIRAWGDANAADGEYAVLVDDIVSGVAVQTLAPTKPRTGHSARYRWAASAAAISVGIAAVVVLALRSDDRGRLAADEAQVPAAESVQLGSTWIWSSGDTTAQAAADAFATLVLRSGPPAPVSSAAPSDPTWFSFPTPEGDVRGLFAPGVDGTWTLLQIGSGLSLIVGENGLELNLPDAPVSARSATLYIAADGHTSATPIAHDALERVRVALGPDVNEVASALVVYLDVEGQFVGATGGVFTSSR